MSLSKEKAAELLFEVCKDRSLTSKEATALFLSRSDLLYNEEKFSKVQELVRNYKNTGNNLGDIIDQILLILNQYSWIC